MEKKKRIRKPTMHEKDKCPECDGLKLIASLLCKRCKSKPERELHLNLTERECTGCLIVKPISEFGSKTRNQKTYPNDKRKSSNSKCKQCENAIRNLREKAKRDLNIPLTDTQIKSRARNFLIFNKLVKREDVKESEVDLIFNKIKTQEHCEICGVHKEEFCNSRTKSLSIDHCHKTGQVRGMLCHNCNLSLGGFDDSIANLEKAIDYLVNYKKLLEPETDTLTQNAKIPAH